MSVTTAVRVFSQEPPVLKSIESFWLLEHVHCVELSCVYVFVLWLKLTFKEVFEEASMASPVQCVCIYRECVSSLLSDVKGHVRVGYLFIGSISSEK